MRDKNWQPYSINFGTTEKPQWVEYKRLDPYFFTFGVVGDILEMMQASQNDPSFDGATLLTMALGSTFNTLAFKTWLQGISDVVGMIDAKAIGEP